jgi:hypothetical protein
VCDVSFDVHKRFLASRRGLVEKKYQAYFEIERQQQERQSDNNKNGGVRLFFALLRRRRPLLWILLFVRNNEPEPFSCFPCDV